MTLVLFDLDKTLLDCNSATLWVRAELRDGRIGARDALRAGWWILRYYLGLDGGGDAIRLAVARLAGEPEDELAARTERWFEREVRGRLRPGAVAAMDEHRRAGHKLVMATAGSPYLARVAARVWGMSDCICTEFEVREGRFTGQVSSLAYGAHKAERVSAWALIGGEDLAQAVFYTDSITDLALLELVGRPVVVNPDPRLKRIAQARGWEELDWGLSTATTGAHSPVEVK